MGTIGITVPTSAENCDLIGISHRILPFFFKIDTCLQFPQWPMMQTEDSCLHLKPTVWKAGG